MSKKKKLIVVSSVLAVCMLCSLSVLALSSQEETEILGNDSAVISKQSEEQVLTVEQFSQLVEGETTYEEVISTVGQPCANTGFGFIWDVYYTTDGDKVCILYNHNVVDEIQIL